MGKKLGPVRRPAAGVGAVRGEVLDARDDGDRPQHRPERPVGARARGQAGRQRAVRVRLLPPADPDVRQDRAGHRRRALRGRARRGQAGEGQRQRPRPRRRRPAQARRDVQGGRRRARRAARSRRTRASRWTSRSGRSSSRGTPSARSSTAARSASRPTSAPRSTSARWCSATSTWTRAPASRSPATRPRGAQGIYGDYLQNAQGEDVVAGIRNTVPLADLEQIDKRCLRRAARHHADARGALPRPVRHRVHHRARQAVDAADPGRQAHRRRRRSASPPSSSTRA